MAKKQSVRRTYFGTSGMRGVFGADFRIDLFYRLGLSIRRAASSISRVCVGRDGRTTSETMQRALVSGLLVSGVEVFDCGLCPTPVLPSTVVETASDAGVMVTASHNPPQYIGAKLFDRSGAGFPRETERKIEDILNEPVESRLVSKTQLHHIHGKALTLYIRRLMAHFSKSDFSSDIRVLVDCGHGATSTLADKMFLKLPIQARVINNIPDGLFPSHPPEPTAENLKVLSRLLKPLKSDLLLAFDGDGDRLAVFDGEGNLIETDLVLAILLEQIARRSPGKVVLSVNMSNGAKELVEKAGGTVVYAPLGKTYRRMMELNGVAAAEPWKLIDPAFGLWEDGIYSSLLLLKTITKLGGVERFLHSLPKYHKFEIDVRCPDELKQQAQERAERELARQMKTSEIMKIDGARLDFPDGSWILIRPSGTESKMRVYGEARDKRAKDKLMETGRSIIEESIGTAAGR